MIARRETEAASNRRNHPGKAPFGYAFFPAILPHVTRTIATSLARYRALGT